MRARIVVVAAGLLLVAGCSLRSSLPEMGEVPAFSLTDSRGEPFNSSQLNGKVWVASFIFTTCNGPCPRMSSQMRRLQKDLAADPEIRFLSFTVDPENDTPPALAAYARRYDADPKKWFFLTGPPSELQRLSLDTFHLGSIGGPQIEHSSRFVLIDGKSRIRGYYDSSDPAAYDQLRADIGSLHKEIL